MSRGDDDTDTDADMDGLVHVCGSTSSSCSGSPLPGSATSSSQVHEMLRTRSVNYTRDDTYYFEDGSSIILIEETLFNVSIYRASVAIVNKIYIRFTDLY